MSSPFSGADLVAEALAQMGVRDVFGIVSIHNMPLFDAINRLGRTRIIDVRHEQAGTHAADGYARATGQMGVMIASTGPGTSNTITGLYEAQYASSRVLVITGQAETAYYGKGIGYVHEAEGQVAMLRSVCRRVESPRHVSQLAPALNAVVADIHCGRAAPGAIEIPIDLQYAEAQPVDFAVPAASVHQPDPQRLEEFTEHLTDARRRVIVAGGGVVAAGAGDALRRLAETLDAPVLTSADGRGALPEDHPLCIGNFYTSAGMYQAIQEADLTLAVGTRFAVGVDGQASRFKPPGRLLQIDIDPAMIGRTHSADLGLAADARLALEAINQSLVDVSGNDAQFNATVLEASDGVHAAMRRRLGDDYPRVMDLMREKLPRDGIFVRDQTIAAYNFGNQLFPIYEPRTTMNPVSGAIGPGFPLAIGAALATGRQTLLIHGDGGFMYHATELATCAQYQLPLVIVVFNDGGYGVLRWLQETRFGRINETDLGTVDFARMAESMGVPGCRVASVAQFDEALDAGMAAPGPYLIDVDMESFAPMEISIMPKKRDD
ncbi:MAG: thiamine pyrophosphate-binding protein [Gammaproteobacteria bacterium]|nr:thiamine pyrophosphate-binding protein [Gammaproteobacteria bacterium]